MTKPKTKFAAVGTDGKRLVVWGLGDSADEALHEAERELFVADSSRQCFEVHEITADQAETVTTGDVSWPIKASL